MSTAITRLLVMPALFKGYCGNGKLSMDKYVVGYGLSAVAGIADDFG